RRTGASVGSPIPVVGAPDGAGAPGPSHRALAAGAGPLMKRALVVVDMIEDFVHEGGALYCGPSMARIVPVIQKEIARARGAAESVVYLTDNHLPDDAEFQMFPPHAIAGTKGAEIVPELAPGKDDVVIPKRDRKSTRLNSSHQITSYAVFCMKKKKNNKHRRRKN